MTTATTGQIVHDDARDGQQELIDAIASRLSKDLEAAARVMGSQQVRYLVDTYYERQEARITAKGRIRAMAESGEPTDVIDWVARQNEAQEKVLKRALLLWCREQPVYAGWLGDVYGVGPVIAAGFLANLDPVRAKSAGGYWSFCGMDPSKTWGKGQKRPWNAAMKRLTWIFGSSMVKFRNSEKCWYGHRLQEKWDELHRINDAGGFGDAAAASAEKVGKTTETFKHNMGGKLSPGHVMNRATRWIGKLFLSNLFDAQWAHATKTAPPRPYVIEHGGHVHVLYPPGLQAFIESQVS